MQLVSINNFIYPQTISKKVVVKSLSFLLNKFTDHFNHHAHKPLANHKCTQVSTVDFQFANLLELAPLEGKRVAQLFKNALHNINLENLKETGLTDEELDSLMINAASVTRLDEFMKLDPLQGMQATILGTSANDYILDLTEHFHGRDFIDAYIKLTGKFLSNTPLFLTRLMAEGMPIIFFMPPNLKRSPTTAAELKWFLEHPTAMKNVHFVYGAYDVLTSTQFGIIEHKYTLSEIDTFHEHVFKHALNELFHAK